MEASGIMSFSLSFCCGSINRYYLFEVPRHRDKCEDGMVHITLLLKSFCSLIWRQCGNLAIVLCGNQERTFAWKSREWILVWFPKASISVSFIFISPNIILLVEFMDGFNACKFKIISSHELFEPHPSSYQLFSLCPILV